MNLQIYLEEISFLEEVSDSYRIHDWVYLVVIEGSLLLVFWSTGVIVHILMKRKKTSRRIKANETKLGNH